MCKYFSINFEYFRHGLQHIKLRFFRELRKLLKNISSTFRPKLSREVEDFHILEDAVLYLETQRRADNVPALNACRTGIDRKEIVFPVVHHLEYVRVATDEDIRMVGIYHSPHIERIFSRIATDMGHQYLQVLTVEKLDQRALEAYFLRVAVAIDPKQGLE